MSTENSYVFGRNHYYVKAPAHNPRSSEMLRKAFPGRKIINNELYPVSYTEIQELFLNTSFKENADEYAMSFEVWVRRWNEDEAHPAFKSNPEIRRANAEAHLNRQNGSPKLILLQGKEETRKFNFLQTAEEMIARIEEAKRAERSSCAKETKKPKKEKRVYRMKTSHRLTKDLIAFMRNDPFEEAPNSEMAEFFLSAAEVIGLLKESLQEGPKLFFKIYKKREDGHSKLQYESPKAIVLVRQSPSAEIVRFG